MIPTSKTDRQIVFLSRLKISWFKFLEIKKRDIIIYQKYQGFQSFKNNMKGSSQNFIFDKKMIEFILLKLLKNWSKTNRNLAIGYGRGTYTFGNNKYVG